MLLLLYVVEVYFICINSFDIPLCKHFWHMDYNIMIFFLLLLLYVVEVHFICINSFNSPSYKHFLHMGCIIIIFVQILSFCPYDMVAFYF